MSGFRSTAVEGPSPGGAVDNMTTRTHRGRWPAGLLGMVALVVAVESWIAADWLRLTEPSALAWPLSAAAASAEARGAEVLCFGDSLVKHGILPEVLEARLGVPAYNLALPASTAPAQYYLLRRALRAGAAPRAIVVDYMPGLLTGTPPFGLPYWAALLGAADLADLALTWRRAEFAAEAAVRLLLPSFQSRWAIRDAVASALRGQTPRNIENNLMLRRNWRLHRGAQFTQDNPGWDGIPTEAEHERHLSTRFWCHPVNKLYIHKFLDLAESRGIRVYWVLPPVTPEIQRRRVASGADEKYSAFAREVIARHPGVVVLDARPSGYDHTRFVDSLHLTGKGALALSADVAEAIASDRPKWVTLPPYRDRAPDRPFEEVEQSRSAVLAGLETLRR